MLVAPARTSRHPSECCPVSYEILFTFKEECYAILLFALKSNEVSVHLYLYFPCCISTAIRFYEKKF